MKQRPKHRTRLSLYEQRKGNRSIRLLPERPGSEDSKTGFRLTVALK